MSYLGNPEIDKHLLEQKLKDQQEKVNLANSLINPIVGKLPAFDEFKQNLLVTAKLSDTDIGNVEQINALYNILTDIAVPRVWHNPEQLFTKEHAFVEKKSKKKSIVISAGFTCHPVVFIQEIIDGDIRKDYWIRSDGYKSIKDWYSLNNLTHCLGNGQVLIEVEGKFMRTQEVEKNEVLYRSVIVGFIVEINAIKPITGNEL